MAEIIMKVYQCNICGRNTPCIISATHEDLMGPNDPSSCPWDLDSPTNWRKITQIKKEDKENG